ncbi:MAG: energy transducer TonB [Proteobacteria bacterium]|nr:energy transducer TonB [Pseudomonadota bacterium]
MFARYISAVSTGTFMTIALLYVMQLLISLQPGAQTEDREHHFPGLLPTQRPDTPVRPEDTIIRRENLTKTEVPPARPRFSDGVDTIRVPRGTPTAPPGDHHISFAGFNDGALVNLVRVGPVYPARAIAQGVEGHVIVQFDVTAEGKVVNIVIVESSNSVFDNAAIKAAARFKFKPRVVDGIALVSTGIQNLFTFRLDDL